MTNRICTKWVSDLMRLSQKWGDDCITESDPRYEGARLVFNRFHDLRPGAIVRPSRRDSVKRIVRFAADRGILVAVRGGGHHIAGYGSCDGGLVIDFSACRGVRVEGDGMVEVDPGARLRDVDRELNSQGLVIPTGTVSDTGIAGLTLGGGIGWLVGKYGLTCDHLAGADVVLSNGCEIRAEAPQNHDLLWALRGGGGNFGVITQFRYQARPLPSITAGSAAVPFQRAADALEGTIDFLSERCPPELTVAPSITCSQGGMPALTIDFCLAGANDEALQSLARAVGPARWSRHEGVQFSWWQQSMDHLFSNPMRGYWKARYGPTLTRSDINILFEKLASAPSLGNPRCRTTILIEHLHGAFSDVGIDFAAFPLRSARFGVLLSTRWADPQEDQRCISWVRNVFSRLDPDCTSTTYSNYALQEDVRALGSFQEKASRRLEAVKKMYDPENLFRRNHNIPVISNITELSQRELLTTSWSGECQSSLVK